MGLDGSTPSLFRHGESAGMLKPDRLAIGLVLASGLLAVLAVQTDNPVGALLLGWTTVACAITALAYHQNWPWVHGKRAGRLTWRSLPTLPFLAAYRLACPIVRSLHPDSDPLTHIGAGIWVGGRIPAGQLPPGKPAILDLTAEVNEHAAIRCLPGYRQLAALDGHLPRDEELADAIRALARVTAPVVIHCESGRGRAPTTAAGVLLARGMAYSIDEAFDQIRSQRRIAPTLSDYRALERIRPTLLVARGTRPNPESSP